MENRIYKQKFIFVLFLTFLSLLLVACVKIVKKGIEIIKGPEEIREVGEIREIGEIGEVKEGEEIEKIEKVCEELETEVELCILNRAVENKNISDCLKLRDEYNGTYFEECIRNFSEIDYKYYKYCKYLGGIKADNCIYDSITKYLGNYNDSICNEIINESIRSSCLILFISEKCKDKSGAEMYICDSIEKEDESICEKLSGDDRDECYFNFSLSIRNVCDDIATLWGKAACHGIVEKDYERCDTLEFRAQIDSCYKIISAKTGECWICENCITVDPYKDDCYKECSLSSNNFTYCRKLSTETKRDDCFRDFAIEKKEINSCLEIKYISKRNYCIRRIAVDLVEPKYCEEIEIENRKECYDLAIIQENLTIEKCLEMEESYSKDQCILRMRKRTGNESYCSYIKDSMLRDYCESLD